MFRRTAGITSLIAVCAAAGFGMFAVAADKPADKPGAPAAETRAGFDVKGNWLGTLQVAVVKLRLGFAVRAGESGGLTAKLFSIDQGNTEVSIDAVEVQGDKVAFVIKPITARFDGRWNAERGEIAGEWKQGTQTLPLVLKKVDVLPGLERPQEPKKPYPYREEEVSFKNTKHGVTLNGTLTLPKGAGPFPAVVLISGSGPQDRNEELMGHRPFLPTWRKMRWRLSRFCDRGRRSRRARSGWRGTVKEG